MYRVWYWAIVDRETDGRFIASIPDLGDLAAYGDTDKDAVAHVTDLAAERVRAATRLSRAGDPRADHVEAFMRLRGLHLDFERMGVHPVLP